MQENRDEAEQARRTESDFATLIASKPRREKKSAVFATTTSLVSHAFVVAIGVWVTAGPGLVKDDKDKHEVVSILSTIDEPVPPPPPPPVQPDQPLPDVIPDVPGFETLQPPVIILNKIPPIDPARVVTGARFTGQGVEGNPNTTNSVRAVTEAEPGTPGAFVPMTQQPMLKNVAEVERALQRLYPPLLRDAGVGGSTIMWFLIDEQGMVVKTQVFKPSGYKQFDDAAVNVAEVMRFSPAKNHEKVVRVWVQVPITFTARQPDK
jgi:protein TonB